MYIDKFLVLNKFKSIFSLSVIILMLFNIIGVSFAQTKDVGKDLTYPYYSDAVSCDPSKQQSQGSSSIFLLGDSLTVGMRESGQLKEKLEKSNWKVTGIEATVGDKVSDAIPKIETNKELIKQSGTIVIMLGTNKDGNFSAKLVELITKIRDQNSTAQLYWMTAYTKAANYDDINGAIRSQSQPQNYKVIDWFTEATTNPGPYIFSGEGIHNTAAGYGAKADYLVKSLGPPPQSGAGSPTTDGAVLTSNNKGYNGQDVWTPDELAKIEQNKPIYEQAGKETGIPWQMLATLHRKEYGLKRENPSNGQGIYQLYSYTGGGSNGNAFRPAGPVSDQEFLRQSVIAANIFKSIANGNNAANKPLDPSNPTPNSIKDTFFGYNGRSDAYKRQAASLGFNSSKEGYEGSPYVMNKADARRDPDSAAPGTWGQIKTDRGGLQYPTNKDWGAWIYYAALAGIQPGSGGGGQCTSSSGGAGGVNAEGYSFPVEPQTKSGNSKVNGMSPLPCPGGTNCHGGRGEGSAFDIGRQPGSDSSAGAAIYAMSDGEITYIKDNYKGNAGCFSIGQKSSKDNFQYAYLHTSNPLVSPKQNVRAGEKIAEIGRRACTGNGSDPHLHIDRGCVKNGIPQPGGSPSCRDGAFKELMNNVFNSLPS